MFALFILPALALQMPAPEALDIRPLAWLQGRWVGANGTEHYEEHWSLQGQSLVGLSRTMEKDRSIFFELFNLEREGEHGKWVLRIRMFGPALDKALRGSDEPLRLNLVEADASHMRFEGAGTEAGTSLVYRTDGPGKIVAELSKSKNGKPWKETYHFMRAK